MYSSMSAKFLVQVLFQRDVAAIRAMDDLCSEVSYETDDLQPFSQSAFASGFALSVSKPPQHVGNHVCWALLACWSARRSALLTLGLKHCGLAGTVSVFETGLGDCSCKNCSPTSTTLQLEKHKCVRGELWVGRSPA